MGSCGCGGAVNTSDLWEARTVSNGVLEVAPGRTQGSKDEAIQAARGRQDAYLVRV